MNFQWIQGNNKNDIISIELNFFGNDIKGNMETEMENGKSKKQMQNWKAKAIILGKMTSIQHNI